MGEELIKLKLDTTEAKRQVDDLRKQAAQGVAIDARVNAANMRSFQKGQQSDAMYNASMVGLDGGGWGGRVGGAFSLGGYAAAGYAAAGAGLWGLASVQTDIAMAKIKAGGAIGATSQSSELERLRATGSALENSPYMTRIAGGEGANQKVATASACLDQVAGVRDAVAARVDAILGPVAQGGRATVDKATVDAVTAQAIQEQVALAKQQADDLRSANEYLKEIADKMGYAGIGAAISNADQGAGSRR